MNGQILGVTLLNNTPAKSEPYSVSSALFEDFPYVSGEFDYKTCYYEQH